MREQDPISRNPGPSGPGGIQIDSVPSQDRDAVVSLLMSRLEEGDSNYRHQLEWLLVDRYCEVLSDRIATLPADAHGQTYLPCPAGHEHGSTRTKGSRVFSGQTIKDI